MFKTIYDEVKRICEQIFKPISTFFKANNEIVAVTFRAIGILLPFSTLSEISKTLEKNRTDLDTKIEIAHNSLENTSNVLKELEEVLVQNTKSLEGMKTEYERLSKLTEIEEEEDAKALLDEVAVTINKGKTKERWITAITSLVISLIIFVLGIWLGPIITDWLRITGQ